MNYQLCGRRAVLEGDVQPSSGTRFGCADLCAARGAHNKRFESRADMTMMLKGVDKPPLDPNGAVAQKFR